MNFGTEEANGLEKIRTIPTTVYVVRYFDVDYLKRSRGGGTLGRCWTNSKP
jgi:hypothetical protein